MLRHAVARFFVASVGVALGCRVAAATPSGLVSPKPAAPPAAPSTTAASSKPTAASPAPAAAKSIAAPKAAASKPAAQKSVGAPKAAASQPKPIAAAKAPAVAKPAASSRSAAAPKPASNSKAAASKAAPAPKALAAPKAAAPAPKAAPEPKAGLASKPPAAHAHGGRADERTGRLTPSFVELVKALRRGDRNALGRVADRIGPARLAEAIADPDSHVATAALVAAPLSRGGPLLIEAATDQLFMPDTARAGAAAAALGDLLDGATPTALEDWDVPPDVTTRACWWLRGSACR